MNRRFAFALALLTTSACGSSVALEDAAVDARVEDAGPDAFVTEDAGTRDSGGEDAGGDCAPVGSMETVDCGNCGSRTRVCTEAGWDEGVCADEGVCEAGTTRSSTCGNCGTLEERCDATCAWMPVGDCTDEGECAPEGTLITEDGCPADETRELLCNASCVYEEVSACRGAACDPPGALEEVPCGLCGTRERFCTVDGVWTYDECVEAGECAPGTRDMVDCGFCGTQARRCTADCMWEPGACEGELDCTPAAPTCVDASTLRITEVAGCAADACMFTEREVTCPCADGRCSGLIEGLGGPAGYGTEAVPVGDDVSSPAISVTTAFPTGIHFYDTFHTSVFVNTNGNMSFGAARTTYTAAAFPASPVPLIATWFGDVDTRTDGRPAQNNVHWFVDGTRVIATWHQVGYYAMHEDLLNSFQMVITERSDVAPGDFDLELRYGQCEWTTGDASGGTGGLGGSEARAGFDAGDMLRGQELPGSGTPAVLDLCTMGNAGTPGVWSFQFRDGLPL